MYVVFAGPTLSPEQIAQHLPGATVMPPVSQGDVYRVSRQKPHAIGIIDGYFELVPAVWHKEILWAMREGIHVFGAASMGALRAAELARYGMVGVGTVFEAFHRELLQDDDEVAVTHGPADSGYRKLSEAMVNMRVTFERALAEGVIKRETMAQLNETAKALFYGQRRYDAVLAGAEQAGGDAAEIERLRRWLPDGRVDQKALDAVAMLVRMRALHEGPQQPLRVRFHFEHTDMWEQVGKREGRDRLGTVEETQIEPLLDELRLRGAEAYAAVSREAYRRAAGLALSARQGHRPQPERVTEGALRFRRERDLRSAEALDGWLSQEQLSAERFGALMADNLRLDVVADLYAPEIAAQIRAVLQLDGAYGELSARAADKQRTLSEKGLERPGLDESRLDETALLAWHFEQRLGRPVPDDLGVYLRAIHCPSRDVFLQILLRERWYRRLREDAEPVPSGDTTEDAAPDR